MRTNTSNKLEAAKNGWQQLKTNKKAMRKKRLSGRGRGWQLAE